MNSNVNLESFVGAPRLSGTGFVLPVLGLVFVQALWAGKTRRAESPEYFEMAKLTLRESGSAGG